MKSFLDEAVRLGFTGAVYLCGLELKCDPKIRALCNPEQCPNYAQNWVCPPGCGTPEQCGKKLAAFNEGLLLQSLTELDPPTKPNIFRQLQNEHNLRLKALIGSVKPRYAKILPLTTGGCVLCEQCSYPNPCAKPELKMESLSAFGIDVTRLCGLAGLPFAFRGDRLYYMALLLVKL